LSEYGELEKVFLSTNGKVGEVLHKLLVDKPADEKEMIARALKIRRESQAA
jgi:hypothetical protein